MARKGGSPDVRRLIGFDRETYHALHQLSLDRSATLQELAEEAFRDLLRKHRRPVGLNEMLRQSARNSNDEPAARKSRRKSKG